MQILKEFVLNSKKTLTSDMEIKSLLRELARTWEKEN
tara:strand:+ start:462 stop:572 length:111 start_codon:yes stop_codon:yes gene_type:complete